MIRIFTENTTINGIAVTSKDRQTYNHKYEDIAAGEIWYVNFPHIEMDIDDKTEDRPCLVYRKHTKGRIIEVVKGTHSSKVLSDNEIIINGVRLDCSTTAEINERHFRHKKCRISFGDVIKVQNKIKEVQEKGEFHHLKLEQFELFMKDDDIITEAKLKSSERTDFGLPEKKKYPMPDADHVRAAIRMFNHCDPEDEAELARNIKKYMKKHGVKDIKVSDSNRFSKYYNEGAVMEGIEERYLNENDLRYFAALDDYEKEFKKIFGENESLGKRRNENWYEIGYLRIKHAKMASKLFDVYKANFEAIYNSLVEKGFDVIFEDDDNGYIIRYNPNTFGDNVVDSMSNILSESAMISEAAKGGGKNDSIYDGMKTNQNENEWLMKIKNIPLSKEALLRLGYPLEYANKPQPCIMINGKKYRARAELLLINDNGEVLLQKGKYRGGFPYTLCGGGIDDPRQSIATAAIRECEEEALIVPKNVSFTGIVWFMKYTNEVTANDGAVVFVCIGEYDRPYKGYVKKIDRDSFATKSEWVNTSKFKLGEPHKKALDMYYGESAIQESADSQKFKDMKFIYDSLSDKEKSYMGNKFIDSPAVVFRKVAYTNNTNTPVGFVELYDAEKLHGLNDEVIIEAAVHKHYRGNGVAKALVKAAIKWFKSRDKYQKIIYLIKEGNKASKALCEATGFKYIYTEREHDVYYFVKNDTPLTEEFLFGNQEEESDDIDIYLDSFDEEVETPENIARDIKAFVNESKNRLSSIEEMSGGGGPMIGMEINDISVQNSAPGMYIIAYGQKKVSNYTDDDGNESGYAIANDFYTKHIFVKKGKKAVREDYNEFLDKRTFRIYKYIGEMTNWYNLLKSIKENKCDGEFYTALTGRQLLTMDQIDFDENFEYLNLWKVMLEADINHPVRDIIKSDPVILLPCVNEEATSLAKDLRKMNPYWDLREGVEGYYVVDEKSGFRSNACDKDFLMKVLDK